MSATPDAREIAALVAMSRLLAALGSEVNVRTRRGPCPVHGGKNPTAFAWHEDGYWHCFSCGSGGDRIALVRAARQCSLREAVEFLAALAGVRYRDHQISPGEVARAQCERDALCSDARTFLEIQDGAWREAREAMLRLEAIRSNAGRRLDVIHREGIERWPGEAEACWDALAQLSREMPRVAAVYNVISFAPRRERLDFALDPQAREWLICGALECGYVADERGYRFEVQS